MEKRMRLWAGLTASLVLALSGTVLAQNRPLDCPKLGSPQEVKGQVTSVDPERGKITLRGANGATYEFQAPKETVQQYKVGDNIEAKLRSPQNCPPSAS